MLGPSNYPNEPGVNVQTIRSRARNHHWSKLQQSSQSLVDQIVNNAAKDRLKKPIDQLSEDAIKWIDRVKKVAERHLEAVEDKDPGKLDLKDLDTLTKVTDLVDRLGRRQHGLDDSRAVAGPRTLVQVSISSLADTQRLIRESIDNPGSIEVVEVTDDE